MYRLHLTKMLVTLLLLTIAQFTQVAAQCEGPKNNGQQFVIDLGNGTSGMTSASFSVANVTLTIQNNSGLIQLSAPGITFHTDGAGNVQRLDAGADVPNLSNFQAGPVTIFNTNTDMGAFGGGISGFIGIQSNGKFGWLEFNSCGSTTCNDYVLTVANGGLDQSGQGTAVAGDCSTLFALIPTLSQWGLIILGLLVLNLGLYFVRRRETILRA